MVYVLRSNACFAAAEIWSCHERRSKNFVKLCGRKVRISLKCARTVRIWATFENFVGRRPRKVRISSKCARKVMI